MFEFLVPSRVPLACQVVALAVLCTGCGNSDPETNQILAKVDGQGIALSQLNGLLAKAEGVTPDTITAAKQEILGRLVEQQLAVNWALEKKLERKPEVANAIEASRREILARAALDQIAGEAPKAGEEEAKRYYADKPELFAARRIYTVQEIVLKRPVVELEKLRSLVATAKRMDEVAAWLKDKKIEFTSGTTTKPAEDLLPDALAKLRNYRDGQIGLLESRDAYTVTQLVASHPQPIASAKALDGIVALLNNQYAAQAVKQAKIEMKAAAKLEFMGDFAGGEAAFKAGAVARSEDSDEANARAKADAKIVEQGIKGL